MSDKSSIIEGNRLHESDTGSPEVQIALLSERIDHLTEHFKITRRTTTVAAAFSHGSDNAILLLMSSSSARTTLAIRLTLSLINSAVGFRRAGGGWAFCRAGVLATRHSSSNVVVIPANDDRGFIIALDDGDLSELVKELKESPSPSEFTLLRHRFQGLVL